MNGGQVEWRTKVVVGKPETQTAVFSDEMETVVMNPYWGVPKSILYYEMLPYLANDPYYLDLKGFEIFKRQRQADQLRVLNWWSYGENIHTMSASGLGKPTRSGTSNSCSQLPRHLHARYPGEEAARQVDASLQPRLRGG